MNGLFLLTDAQLSAIVRDHIKSDHAPDSLAARRFQLARALLFQRGWVVDDPEETEEHPIVPREAYED